MAEGYKSIGDLTIRVNADLDSLSSGLTQAQGIVQQFSAQGVTSLGFFDKSMEGLSGKLLGLRGALGTWTVAIDTAFTLLSSVAEKGDAVAKLLGVEDDWNRLKNAVSEIIPALQEGLPGALSASVVAAYDFIRSMAGAGDASSSFLGSTLAVTESVLATIVQAYERTSRRVSELAADLATQLERGQHEIRRFTAIEGWSQERLHAELERTQRYIEGIKQRIDAIAEGGVSWWERLFGVDAETAIDKLKTKLEEFQSYATKMKWRDVVTDTENYDLLKPLDAQIRALQIKGATLGMTAAAAATYTAQANFMNEALLKGLGVSEQLASVMREKAEAIGAATQKIDDHNEALRRQQDSDRLNEAASRAFEQQMRQEQQRAKQADALVESAGTELAAMQRRTMAIGDTTGATAALVAEERLLQQARMRGIELSADHIAEIKQTAAAIGEATVAYDRAQRSFALYGEVGQLISRDLSSAWTQYTRGSIRDGEDWMRMLRGMSEHLRDLLIQKLVFQQLGNVVTQGLTQGLGLQLPLAGARAEGGPVDAGQLYLVGERGPELFRPSVPGTVVANGGFAGGATPPPNVLVNITAPAGTTARETGRSGGAGDLSIDIMIEQIDGALAQRVGDDRSALGETMKSRFGLSSAAGAR